MKKVKLFEAFLNENANYKELINTRFRFEVGSGYTGALWSEEDFLKELKTSIKHELFDWDFYYNWTDSDSEYMDTFEKETLAPLMKNVQKTLKSLYTFDGKTLKFKGDKKYNSSDEFKDNWFQTTKISKQLKKDYYDYREEYAGVVLK